MLYLTNFHLPRSSLLALVAAFAGTEATLRYRVATLGLPIYSYGDAMLIPVTTFRLLHEDAGSAARRGRLTLGHGEVDTPAFMPVATHGKCKRAHTRREYAQRGRNDSSQCVPPLAPTRVRLIEAAVVSIDSWLGRAILTIAAGVPDLLCWHARARVDKGSPFARTSTARTFADPGSVIRGARTAGQRLAMILDECPLWNAIARRSAPRWSARRSGTTGRECARVPCGPTVFGIVQGWEHSTADGERKCDGRELGSTARRSEVSRR